MNNLQTEPEATTDTLVSTTENTKVETELTKEQLADREKVNAINNTIEKAGKQFILNRIKLGLLLVNLKKKHKELFWTVIDTNKVSQKTLERAMMLVLKDESVFPKAMSNDGGEKDIAENVELLVIDKNVKALDMKALSKLNKPTLNKIANMKHLSDKDWKIVLSGSDKPYKEYMAKKAIDDTKAKEKKLLEVKPTTMNTDTFIAYTKAEPIVLINEIADNGVKIATLEEKIALLEKLVPVSITNKHYTVSNETKSEKA